MTSTGQLSARRLADDLETLAGFGALPAPGAAHGGMTRLALSAEDAAARAWVAERMRALGLRVDSDDVGNLYGRRAGTDTAAAAVLTGSHIDTVPAGGRYDGPLGVLGALEMVRAWNEAGVTTRRPIEVAVFVGEEGSRFRRGTIGSAALAGDVAVAEIHALRDDAGTSFRDALATYGDPPAMAVRRCPAARDAYHAFVELHIEQGGVLESRKLAIGAVETICGLLQRVVTFDGVANHAGATPMDMRHDALAAAAEVTTALHTAARGIGGGAVATVGRLTVEPNAFNIIPGRVTLGIDMRAPDEGLVDRLEAALDGIVRLAARSHGVEAKNELRQRVPSGPMAKDVVAAVERAARDGGHSCMRMPSGAIHDALHVANFTRAGMIFVPSIGGRSHCPEEISDADAMIRGVDVLGRTLVDLAG